MIEQIGYILFGATIMLAIDFFKKSTNEIYNDAYDLGYQNGTENSMFTEQEIVESVNTVAKKVIGNVIDEKINDLKQAEKNFGEEFLPIKIEIMKLENIKDELRVAMDDEFLLN